MAGITRKPLQGITNIIRFNWHYYVIAFCTIIAFYFLKNFLPRSLSFVCITLVILAIAGTLISLLVSWYIYDHSNLYSLNWLTDLKIGAGTRLVNINAGFDETSMLLAEKYPGAQLLVFDFYDPTRHTEISIERARKAYPAFPGTIPISSTDIPLAENSVDYIFLILSAHEIRSDRERIVFFKQLKKALADKGRIIVTEHQRDFSNFLAYNMGFFHFLSAKTWRQTFAKAGLSENSTFKITPFLSIFILAKNGSAS